MSHSKWYGERQFTKKTECTQGFSVSRDVAFHLNQCRGWEQMGKRRHRDVKKLLRIKWMLYLRK